MAVTSPRAHLHPWIKPDTGTHRWQRSAVRAAQTYGVPDEDMPDVDRAAHAVCQEAIDAGVWVCGSGLEDQRASIVAADGTVTDGAQVRVGGLTVIDVPSREEGALVGCQVGRCVRMRPGSLGARSRPQDRRDAPPARDEVTHLVSD
jgi:hypothetical protein